METIQRAKRIGGSIMVRIPKDIVEMEGIQPGESVKLNVQKMRKSWFGAFPQLTPWNKETDRMKSKHE